MCLRFLITRRVVPTVSSLTGLCPITMRSPHTLLPGFQAFPTSDASPLHQRQTSLGIFKPISPEQHCCFIEERNQCRVTRSPPCACLAGAFVPLGEFTFLQGADLFQLLSTPNQYRCGSVSLTVRWQVP